MNQTSSDHPKQLGGFEILSTIGHGGMGTVYVARQLPLGRTVALKCLSRSGDPEAKVRFLREVQALGMVSHPHLIKVFASGSEEGVTFFAMELIEGADLSSICSELQSMNRPAEKLTRQDWLKAFEAASRSQLTTNSKMGESEGPSRVASDSSNSSSSKSSHTRSPRNYPSLIADLMRQVAEAAAALHAVGIVHRDIKPGNIIAHNHGTDIVLMDLGLAHIADSGNAALTRTRQFVGTLRYASPEQVLSSGNVDCRTDIYSIGATLWELLALRPLFASSSDSSDFDIMKRIEYEDPPSVRSLNAAVPVDLSAIADKCLAKNPGRRYQTAAELAEDLRRFLDGETVSARPLTVFQRLSNVVARHPLHATSVALAMIVTSLLFGLWAIRSQLEAQRISNQQLDKANARAEKSFHDAVIALDGIFQLVTSDDLREVAEMEPVQKKLMAYYESYIQQYDQRSEFQLELATAYGRIARINQEMGNGNQSLASYSDGIRLLRGLLDRSAPTTAMIENTVDFLVSRALLFLDKGEYIACAEELAEADRVLKLIDIKGNAPLCRLQAEVHHSRGRMQTNQGKHADSLQSFRIGLALRQELFKSQPDSVTKRDLGRSFGYLGDVEVELGDYAAARSSYISSMRLREELVQEASTSREFKFQLARAHRNLGFLSQLEGNLPDAISSYRIATEIQRKLILQHPTIASYRSDFATDSGALGELLLAKGEIDSAVPLFREALEMAKAVLEKNPKDVATASVAFHAAVLLARANQDRNPDAFAKDLATAEQMVGRLKVVTPDDLFNQALLKKLRQQLVTSRQTNVDMTAVATETAEIALLLTKAIGESRFTVGPRIKREAAFDTLVLPSDPKQSTMSEGSALRGLTRDTKAEGSVTTKLLSLCVGISDYRDNALDLQWAEKDATDLGKLFQIVRGSKFSGEDRILVDQNATRASILESLAKMRELTDASTLFVLHLSGHGIVNSLGEYYFVPHDFDREKVISSTGLSWYDIEQEVKRMNGVVLIILDTCHSGAAVQGGARGTLAGIMDRTVEEIVHQVSLKESKGIVVLSSALTGQASAEKAEWGHGPLTLSIIEALTANRANVGGLESRVILPQVSSSGQVSLESIRNYSVARVNELTQGRQRVICRNSVDLLSVNLSSIKN